ncbi:MAG: filamentous hemagglutinin N-terminal domain-containing protein, partial [Leptolyngbyaceae cyanobacterium]
MGDRSSLLSRRTSFHLGRNRVSDWRGRGAIATSLVMVLGSIGWEQRINPKRAFAQITPDQTLGVTSSRVVASVGQTLIEGGLEQNGNLFHSFQQFNVPLTESVYFANPEGVTNILSRVTGDTPSNILGTLGVKGPANLFLLNPNGILFGPDARLDLGGAFVGSTASQINFDNNQAFSAVTPSTPSMLIISAPIGLQYGTGNPPGPIVVEGRLEVNPGETLTLAGGDIQITGVTGDRDSSSSLPDSSLPDLFLANTGQLIAPQGNISLLAINPSANRNRQTILFGNQFTINEESLPSSPQNSQFANISISRGAFIFAGNNNSVGDAGRIRIDGNNVSIGNNTRLSTRNSGRGDVGLIEINAIAQLDVSNQSTITNQASNRPKREGLLRGILLESTGGSVTVRESTLRTNVESDGTASRILITAADRILISQSTLSSQAQEEAGGGRIRLNAAEATIRDGSNINSGTSSQNQDTDAGKIILEISDQLVINHSQLRSGTDGLSNGDEIRIRAENADVRIINGGRLTSSTSGQGNAGSILVEAQNLWVEGFNAEGQEGDIFSGIFSRVRAEGQGDAQNINIDADTVDLVNGGRISTSVTEGGQGNAGTLTINSNQLNIVSFTTDGPSGRRSGIFARITSDAAGDGGNINLNLRDALQMRN